MEKILNDIYYTADSPAAFSGINTLYSEAKKFLPLLKRKEVKQWLSEQYTYTMHKPARRRFSRNKIYVIGMNRQFQIDLADMVSLHKQNNGYKYLLTCIDVFSKYAWAIPIKNKTGDETVRAFKLVLEDRIPKKVQSDQGKEFLNDKFQTLLETNNIKFFTSKNQEIKCSIVERFNRTIKSKIWKYFSANRTYSYIDIIDNLVDGYNKSYHRSIKMAPENVSIENEVLVRKNLYGNIQTNKQPIFEIGDKVRVSKLKKLFEKGYLPNWSEEIFFVKQIIVRNPIVYVLEDYGGEVIDGFWYEKELQKVIVDKYWIEKVIKRRTYHGEKQVFVKWLGYPDKFNSWISETELNG